MKNLLRILLVTLLTSVIAATQSKPALEKKQQIVVFGPGGEYHRQADEAMHEKRFDDAIRLFEKAAETGDGAAMRFLGDVFYYGKFRAQDFSTARSYYEKAEAIGYLGGLGANNLGVIYAKGLGVKQDYKHAFQLFQKSAARDEPWGMYNLGSSYELGLGVAQDYKQARQWYEKAAAKGIDNAKIQLEKLPK
ncbi:MAG TPA: tetratricopeptide repeat protein [Candidatus Angelobacter sp.]